MLTDMLKAHCSASVIACHRMHQVKDASNRHHKQDHRSPLLETGNERASDKILPNQDFALSRLDCKRTAFHVRDCLSGPKRSLRLRSPSHSIGRHKYEKASRKQKASIFVHRASQYQPECPSTLARSGSSEPESRHSSAELMLALQPARVMNLSIVRVLNDLSLGSPPKRNPLQGLPSKEFSGLTCPPPGHA